VKVTDAVAMLSFNPSSVSAVLGYEGECRTSDFSVMATYNSGRIEKVTDVCSYESDNSCASVDVPGVVIHKDAGTAVVTASYKGKNATLDVNTDAFCISGVEFEEQSYIVSKGETITVRYRVLYNDGTYSSYVGYQFAGFKGGSCNGVMTYDQTIAYLDTYGRLTACGSVRQLSKFQCGLHQTRRNMKLMSQLQSMRHIL
jgi:hypothetical protein